MGYDMQRTRGCSSKCKLLHSAHKYFVETTLWGVIWYGFCLVSPRYPDWNPPMAQSRRFDEFPLLFTVSLLHLFVHAHTPHLGEKKHIYGPMVANHLSSSALSHMCWIQATFHGDCWEPPPWPPDSRTVACPPAGVRCPCGWMLPQ